MTLKDLRKLIKKAATIYYTGEYEGVKYRLQEIKKDIYNDANDEDIDNVIRRLVLDKKDFEARMTRMDYKFKTEIHKVYKLYLDMFN
jgi:hypothetical protein